MKQMRVDEKKMSINMPQQLIIRKYLQSNEKFKQKSVFVCCFQCCCYIKTHTHTHINRKCLLKREENWERGKIIIIITFLCLDIKEIAQNEWLEM
jgi:hypothetical protein